MISSFSLAFLTWCRWSFSKQEVSFSDVVFTGFLAHQTNSFGEGGVSFSEGGVGFSEGGVSFSKGELFFMILAELLLFGSPQIQVAPGYNAPLPG